MLPDIQPNTAINHLSQSFDIGVMRDFEEYQVRSGVREVTVPRR